MGMSLLTDLPSLADFAIMRNLNEENSFADRDFLWKNVHSPPYITHAISILIAYPASG